MEYSNYQVSIFDFIENETGSGIVQAVAGSGKTTTIVEAAKIINGSAGNALFLAFNKSISLELRSRLPSSFDARTFHSLGYMALNNYSDCMMDRKKVSRLLQELSDENADLSYLINNDKQTIQTFVSLCKFYLLNSNTNDSEFIRIIKHHEVSPLSLDDHQLIWVTKKILEMSLSNINHIDFDDMIYIPLMKNMRFKSYDIIFIDEAQDLNFSQQELIRRVLKPLGRIIAVGDRNQAIYGWRGADSQSMDSIAQAFDCQEFPLSVSYRCPKKVIELAQQLVPEIEYTENAIDGEVNKIKAPKPDMFQPNDLVLCRANAPLVTFAYKLIANNIPVRIVGRNIAHKLISLIDLFEPESFDELTDKLKDWEDKTVKRHISRDEYRSANAAKDRAKCIRAFMYSSEERTIKGLIKSIKDLFGDRTKGMVNLSTVHRAKGLQAKNVFIIQHQKYINNPKNKKKLDWRDQEEENINYVAWTRAEETLNFLETIDF